MSSPHLHINTEEIKSDIGNVPTSPVPFQEETSDLDKNVGRQIQLEKLRTLKESNKTLEQNNTERKKYAHCIFLLTCAWAVIIFIIIFLHGFKLMFLSDAVLITLITSTTIQFFGFFLLVVKYLFNTGSKTVEVL